MQWPGVGRLWEPYYASDPPRSETGVDDAYRIRAGDTLRVECDYTNDTAENLTFPQEMCVAFAFFFPGTVDVN